MSLTNIVEDNWGTSIVLTVYQDSQALNISLYTTKNIVLRSPTGDIVTLLASFVTDGSDGKISADLSEDDLDEVGMWDIQAQLSNSGSSISSKSQLFEVHDKLE